MEPAVHFVKKKQKKNIGNEANQKRKEKFINFH
jgi:hypothetical protein